MDVGFGTIWEAVTDRLPDIPAITEPGRTFSRAEFDERASRLATAFADAGVGPGDTVACYLYNGSAYLETVFAAFKLGAVPINANYRYTGSELASLLADADATVLVFSASLAGNVSCDRRAGADPQAPGPGRGRRRCPGRPRQPGPRRPAASARPAAAPAPPRHGQALHVHRRHDR